MRVVVNGPRLRDHFNRIMGVVDKKNSRPILTHCLITATPDHLELVATDLDVAAKTKVEASIERVGSFCINAKGFADILREMPNDNITLELDSEQSVLQLHCNEIHFSLLVFGSEDFPKLTFEGKTAKFKLEASIFNLIINKVFHAISQDETRSFLSSVYLEHKNNELRAVATDSHRLAVVSIPNKGPSSPHPVLEDGIIIPRKGIFEIKKLADHYPNEELEIAVDNSFIYVTAQEKDSLSVRLVAREYLPFETVIGIRTTYTMTADKNVLISSAKRIRTLASERSNGVRFCLGHNELLLLANRPSLGDASEKVPISYEGPEITINFNVKYLIEMLSIFEGGQVTFHFNSDSGPILARFSEAPEFLGVIMPIKL